MKTAEFFAVHPVFTRTEFTALLDASDMASPNAVTTLLQHHLRSGRLLLLRPGLYAVVQPGTDPAQWPVDMFLLSSRLTDDAVISHHSALELLGYAYTTQQRVVITTRHSMRPFQFRGVDVVTTQPPGALMLQNADTFLVDTVDRQGLNVQVTSPERTLVDVLERPRLGGSWEEIWRSLESVPMYNVDQITSYAKLLGNAIAVSKTGFFLEQHRHRYQVTASQLASLHALQPRSVVYMDRHAGGTSVPGWNLIVPEDVLHRSWEEPV
jgi:predicted transcriptional regulator of viral defense system